MLIANPIGDAMNNTEWAFPLAECFHIAAFAMSIGTIAIVDLRLLGLGMRHQTSAQLVQSTGLWTQFGILLAVMSGIFLVSTDPANYLHNPAFRFKISCFLAAIVYNYTLHHKVASSEHSTFAGRLAGAFSLALWLAVVFGGIFYAFV